MPKQPLTKRSHHYYPSDYRREVIEYSALFGHKCPSLVAKNFSIPESTVRRWVKDAKKPNKLLNILAYISLIPLGLAWMFLTGLGVCYLFGGREEAEFFGRTIWELVRSLIAP